MNHPVCRMPVAFSVLSLCLATQIGAAPAITPGPIVELCSGACQPVGGAGLAGNQLGILVDDAGSAIWIVVDRTTGAEVSSTVLGDSAGVMMRDIASDLGGGAWMVGFNDTAGVSTAGRWHSSDVSSRETPTGFDGMTDLLLNSVSSDGTAFGVTASDFATRVLADGTATNLAAGLFSELPTSISDSTSDGLFAVGDAQSSGVLTLAAWDGDTLSYQDTAIGGNGVIGRRLDDTLVIVGIRIGAQGAELSSIADPFGSPSVTTIVAVTTAELSGMDQYGFGYAYGSVEGDAAIIDTNTNEVVLLSDAGISGFASLDGMDHLGGNDWLLVLRGSTHYTLATIGTGGPDTDEDGIGDDTDNCRLVGNPGQEDADSDLIGNICDADYDNNCIVNVVDLGTLKANFFSINPVVDLNSDGIVNIIDLGILKGLFFATPGPGAPGNACE